MGVKLKTRPYGEIEIDERQIIDFPDGIPGFDFVRKFILLDTHDEKSPFKWLQAYDEPELAFIVIRPVDFMKEYELVISQNDLEAVGAKSPEEILVFAIVTIPSNPAEMTANLQGPLLINKENRTGRQSISGDPRWQVRHPILAELVREK